MRRLRITYKGEVYEVDVEEIEVAQEAPKAAPRPIPAAAPAPIVPEIPAVAPAPIVTEGSDEPLEVTAPMSGRIIKIHVEVGTQVAQDEPVAILEAMKMENTIFADRSGTITQLFVKTGQLVDTDEVIAVIG